MVFSNLQPHEKDAFFALLDETKSVHVELRGTLTATARRRYFSSRPDLLSHAGGGAGADAGHAAAASALQHAFSKTTPQQAASTISGLKKSMPNLNYPASSSAEDVNSSSVSGRVAAAAAAFNSSGAPIPRPPPRRGATSTSSEEQAETNKLVPHKKFGDVDISSGPAMFSSLRHSTANKTATAPEPILPPAFSARKNNFAPPPVRRLDATTATAATTPSPPPPPPPPPPVRSRQQEPEGEPAEALYDYSSEDPGDLEITAGQRLVIIERTSDDWWTGEMDGRRGLVPAAYVKVL
ncbi:SH3-domain-containing protein [Laetiporus sulphureus 93-53]|uniref:SH3-domain-containing protein n=1 Tax=Laetiporus sulphureus 93-53 TaxID=1314785 RepID=A0A165I6Q1_9APHY|nr:SH3-domain-containing protein [Laetiporus sulphureus 93-53]KZT12665.1 SH3-domain-containing protein [Laetiporus sulphureus 93-53]